MARPSRVKHRNGPAKRSRARAIIARVFCRRNIIIISDHKTQHVPVHPLLQLVVFVGTLSFVTWASYSTGSYMTAQNVLQEKERKLAFTKVENERIGAEFALLRRDLVKVLKEGDKGHLGDYAKALADQYSEDGAPIVQENAHLAAQNAILTRIEYLENKVTDLQETHDEMMSDIRITTGGKIKELESIIARTGVRSGPLEREAAAKVKREEQQREKYGRTQDADGRGGPFVPARVGLLKEQETDLYFSLKRMMVLHEVVSVMPLSRPIGAARMSSGYGTRIDPFNGRLASHTGQDFAGPRGSRILASADGVVKDTGWQSGYGNAVDISHGYGFTTKYGHLSQILVKDGQHVKKGQAIAIQGSTGRSTGPHLHYEVRYHNKPLNPKSFLNAKRD